MRRVAVLVHVAYALMAVALALAILFTLRGCAAYAQSETPPTDGIIIQLAPGAVAPTGAIAIYGLPNTYALPSMVGKADSETAAEYARRPDVVKAEPNPVVSLNLPQSIPPDGVIAATVNDPYSALQYSLDTMRVYDAWNVSKGDGVVIAVLDSGIDFAHPDLQGKYISRGKDFINGDDGASDDHGHGSHVSGIAAASTSNGVGVAGVGYNTLVLPIKVLSGTGSGTYAQVISGIYYAIDQRAKIINLSLGSNVPTGMMEQAIDYAWQSGALVVCAAGNAGSPAPIYPAAYQGCLAVGATDQTDRRANYSSYSDAWVDVAAPGSGIWSTYLGGGYGDMTGTSMASPQVAGVAALVWARNPSWTNVQVRAAIENGADALPGQQLGRGRVNAARAVGASTSPQPTALPQPQPGGGDYTSQIEQLINQARATNGLPALRIDSRLQAAAAAHNRWMRDTGQFCHECPGEPGVAQRMRNAGYPLISGGEIIGKGYTSPQHMIDGWMGSPSHRAAVLNDYWPDLGCNFLQGPSGQNWDSYWSCELARGSDTNLHTPTPTRTLQPQPTVIIPPTRQPPTPWWNPTATPQPSETLPPGWWMWLRIPVNAQTNGLRAAAYAEYCAGYAGRGATCSYIGNPYALQVVLDYDRIPWIAAHRAYWSYFEPYQRFGLAVGWQPK